MPEPIDLTAEELAAALRDAGVPMSASIDPRGGAMKLATYWTSGPGSAKIRWGSSGDFDRCVMHLGKYVADPKGLCNEYHQMAVGAPPGKGHAASSAVAASALLGVELARPGAWRLSTGDLTFTDQMLRDAADFYTATGGQGIPVGPGHTDPRFDGDPSFGRVTNIRYAADDRGPVLLGDLVDMADWLAAAAPVRWPGRSIEGFTDLEYRGRTYGLALTRLALLGDTPPGIMDLAGLREAVAAAAAQGRAPIAATAPPPTVPPSDPGGTSSPLLDIHARSDQEGAGMDPAKLREALGLDPAASDQDVVAALAAAGVGVAVASAPTPTTPPPAPAPAPTSPPQPAPQPTPPGDPTVSPPPAVPQQQRSAEPSGIVHIDASQLAELQAGIRDMHAVKAKIEADERERAIAAAVRAGKFPTYRVEHYRRAWDIDPAGTRQLLESLQTNLVPVAASGYAGDPDDLVSSEFEHLFPPTETGGGRRG